MSPEEPGPSNPPPTPQLSAARRRVAETLRDLGPHVSLAALSDHLGGHPNSTRAHLDALVTDGLAERSALPASGPGRPANAWTITELGRRALVGDPQPAAYAQLAMILAAQLAESPDAEQVAERVGRAWGASRAHDATTAELLESLGELGFHPQATAGGIRLRTCPLLQAARENPAVICAIHGGMIKGSTGREDVTLYPFSEPGACIVALG